MDEHDVAGEAIIHRCRLGGCFDLYSRIVIVLLTLQAVLLVQGALTQAPTFDEVGHLPAGLSHWHLGRYELYRVNPPLVRMVAALPVTYLSPVVDWSGYSTSSRTRPEFEIGHNFIKRHGAGSFYYFAVARLACIPFAIAAGLVCFLWARDLYGPQAGLFALALWVTCPLALGHGQLITPDVGAAALGAAANYRFWKWLRAPSWRESLLCGFLLGLAELTKSTWILLYLIWPLAWLCISIVRGLPTRAVVKAQAAQLSLMVAQSLLLINLAYRCDGSFQKLKNYEFISSSLGDDLVDGGHLTFRGNRFRSSWLGEVPIPLPREYLLGIDLQKAGFELSSKNYLNGEWKSGGWWYYYLAAFAYKTPIGTILLVSLALLVRLTRSLYNASWGDELFLLAPGILLLVLASAQPNINRHLRYLLPLYPPLYIYTSKLARSFAFRHRGVATISVCCLSLSALSSLASHPHGLSYFNEAVGGGAQGHHRLLGSNFDWGQDLLLLKRWAASHAIDGPFYLAYDGHIDPRDVGVKFAPPPTGPAAGGIGPLPGWYAISSSLFHLKTGRTTIPSGSSGEPSVKFDWDRYGYLRDLKNWQYIGTTIMVRRISPGEVDDLRRRSGQAFSPARVGPE